MLTRSIPLMLYATPLFSVAIFAEVLILRRLPSAQAAAGMTGDRPRGFCGYRLRDAAASITLGILSLLPGFLITAASVPIALWAWHHRFLTLNTGWETWLFAVVLVDFTEYWSHRASHRCRLLWANHVQHHSSKNLNFSTSLRTPLTSFTNIIFFPPLAIFGIQPWIVFAAFGINALYQFWLHTELIGKLPAPVEFVFNTPSHHRVHHGTDGQYIDKNFAGIFIVFDRIFGTFQPETVPVTYGLVHDIDSYNLWTIVTHEYARLLRDVRATKRIKDRIGLIVMPPDWQPAG